MRPGDVLADRFTLERVAASGGMGVVFRACDRDGGLVAVKAVTAPGGDAERRFEREAELLAALRHPGIVSYLAHGRSGDELYLAMEWLDGEDLATRLAVVELDVAAALAVAAQVAAALAAAHALGVVHRDIKPSNIFLTDWRTDQVKLLDFGVARRAGLTALTRSGLLVGTPCYMAPEQARGRQQIDARADVYALGVVLFRCLTGRLPFGGDTPDEVLARLLTEAPPRVRSLAPEVSPALDALVARLLDKDPERRPRDGAALLDALRALDQTPAAPRPAPVADAPAATLVGRVAERAAIARALEAERGTLLLLSGEAGIGKSRLLDEVAAQARARGGAVLRGRAFEAEMIRPYGAWIDALRSAPLGALAPALAADLAPLLPELGGPAEAAERARLFDAVARLLASLPAPAAVLLDDLQWFDEASVALLHYVVRALDGRRVLVASAARAGEIEDNRAAQRLLRDLERERRLVALPLGRLDEREIAALVPGADAARVAAASEGNPLFALELARAGHVESLAALLDDRLARLDDTAREVLPWAAALGRSFDLETLARVTGQPLSALVNVAAGLERRAVVRAGGDARYDFAHDLLREAAYRQLSEPRRRVVHLQIARALAAPTLADTLAGDVAHHAALGGDLDLAVRAALAAGEHGLRIFASAEAAALAERGLALVDRLPRAAALPFEVGLLEVIAISRVWGEPIEVYEARLGRALAEAREAGLPELEQRALQAQATFRYYNHDYEGAAALAQAVTDAAHAIEDAAARARALANAGRCLVHLERDIPYAERLLFEARALAGEARVVPIDLPLGLGLLSCFQGHDDLAEGQLEEAFRRAHRAQDHWRACVALSYLVRVELQRGRPERALERCAALAPVAARLGDSSERPIARALAALAEYMLAGGGADGALEAAIAELVDSDCKHDLAYVLNGAAAVDLGRGDLERARARAERARAVAEAGAHPGEVVLARALLARLALARGEQREAKTTASELTASLSNASLTARSLSEVRRIAAELGLPCPT